MNPRLRLILGRLLRYAGLLWIALAGGCFLLSFLWHVTFWESNGRVRGIARGSYVHCHVSFLHPDERPLFSIEVRDLDDPEILPEWGHSPLWPFLLPGPLLIAASFVRWRSTNPRRCAHCGYDLNGLAFDALCPECGTPRTNPRAP